MNRILAILVFCFSMMSACAQKSKSNFPAPIGYVNDFENVFTVQERKALDSMITAFEKETTVEIAIMTLHNRYAGIEKFDSLVTAIHNEWGIGKKEKNNGVLLAICLPLRKVRISTGRGIEKVLTDMEAKRIIEEILIPEFRDERFYEGSRKGVVAIMNELR